MPKAATWKISTEEFFSQQRLSLPLIPKNKAMEEKPLAEITLADLLQCSPDTKDHRTSIFDHNRHRNIFLTSNSTTVPIYNLPAVKSGSDERGPEAKKPKKPEDIVKCDRISPNSTPVPTIPTTWFNLLAATSQKSVTMKNSHSMKSVVSRNKKSKGLKEILHTNRNFDVGRIVKISTATPDVQIPKRQITKPGGDEMVAEISSTVNYL